PEAFVNSYAACCNLGKSSTRQRSLNDPLVYSPVLGTGLLYPSSILTSFSALLLGSPKIYRSGSYHLSLCRPACFTKLNNTSRIGFSTLDRSLRSSGTLIISSESR